MPTAVMHVFDLPPLSPWFPWLSGIAGNHDRQRFRHLLASIGPRNELHARLEERGMPAFALGARSRRDYPAVVVRLAGLLRRQRIDIVQTHFYDPSVLGLAAATLARTPVRIVTRHHADFTTVFHRPVHRWLDRRQALWAHRVIAVSGATRDVMMRNERVPAERITVAPYGYDFDELRPVLTATERSRLRDEMGGDANTLLVTVGRLDDLKGHRFLLQAAPELLEAHPHVRFVFVGVGPCQADLADQARRAGVADRVSFLGWRADARRVMEAADVVVHPSLTEAFSNVIIEALALERPLIATDVGGATEQFESGESGVLVAPGDPDALLVALLKVLADPDGAAAMGAAGRRRVVERFSFAAQMEVYEQVYDELLGELVYR